MEFKTCNQFLIPVSLSESIDGCSYCSGSMCKVKIHCSAVPIGQQLLSAFRSFKVLNGVVELVILNTQVSANEQGSLNILHVMPSEKG